MGKIYLGETKLADIAPVTSVNGKTGIITLSYSDVGAAASSHTHSQYLTSAPVTSVNNKTGAVSLSASDVGLGNVNNTADSEKSVKYATSAGSATDSTKLPLSGGTVTGTLTISNSNAGYITLRNDGEGGNIDIGTPKGYYWECDAYNESLRFYYVNGSGAVTGFTIPNNIGWVTPIHTGNIGSQSVNYATYGNYSYNNDPGTYSVKNTAAGTGALTAGSSGLTSGYIYLQYT